VVVTGYVCTIVPVLVLSTVLMVAHAPRAFATAYDSAGVQWDRIAAAPGVAAATTGVIQLALLVLPSLGMVLTSGRVGGRVCRSAWCWSEGEPLRRGVLGIGTLAVAGAAAFIWWPNGEYRPIQPAERGTVQAAVRDLSALPTGRPALTPQRERQLGGAPTERQRRRAQLPAAGSPAEQSSPNSTTSTTPSATTTTTSTTDTTTTPTDTTLTETVPGATTPTTPTDTTTTPLPATTTPAGTTTTVPPAGATTTPTTPAPPVTTTP
jgi:putative peptide zinc metalloprotease protein